MKLSNIFICIQVKKGRVTQYDGNYMLHELVMIGTKKLIFNFLLTRNLLGLPITNFNERRKCMLFCTNDTYTKRNLFLYWSPTQMLSVFINLLTSRVSFPSVSLTYLRHL